MKYLLTVGLLLSVSSVSSAYTLEAKSVTEMTAQIKNSQFRHVEDGLAFGFNSILSCLYVSPDFAILKNYCVPKKDYPARGYTIISLKNGVIDLYQEKFPEIIKRDIQISTFPDMLKDFIEDPLEKSSIANLNDLLQILYELNGPACWSTNSSYYEAAPVAACNSPDVINFEEWKSETQNLTANSQLWNELFNTIELAILNK